MTSVRWILLSVFVLFTSTAFAELSPRIFERVVYNPVTGQTEVERRTPRFGPSTAITRSRVDKRRNASRHVVSPDGASEMANYEPDELPPEVRMDEFTEETAGVEIGYGPVVGEWAAEGRCDSIECGQAVQDDCNCDLGGRRSRIGTWFGGVELTFVQPRFEDNLAFTVMESDGTSFESFMETDFDYDLELSPRVFVGWESCTGLGARATWWQFDHDSIAESAQPPANGFGTVIPPPFGDVDLSTSIPTDIYSATSDLKAYALDLEVTKSTSFYTWKFGVSCGVRYARVEQTYQSDLRDLDDELRGEIHIQNSIAGFGPTLGLLVAQPLPHGLSLIGRARGSLLFGNGKSRLAAVEDLDLSAPFTTTETANRDESLSIGEIQCGLLWQGGRSRRDPWQPFLSAALEGQLWNGAGGAANEDGNLGFFGFNVGAGVAW